VPKVQGESRISQAKGQSEYGPNGLYSSAGVALVEAALFFYEKEKRKCKKSC
jgi:hypothetical protein